MIKLIFIFIGGGLGSLSRYGISTLFDSKIYNFPLATLLSNTIACLILGFILGLELKSGISDSTKFFMITGFCGGFSTFSTFSAETMRLLMDGNIIQGMLNIVVSLIVCLFCIFIGIKLGMTTS